MKFNLKKIVSVFFVISTLIILFAPYGIGSTLGNDYIRSGLRLVLYLLSFVNLGIVSASIIERKKITFSEILFLLSFTIYYIILFFHSYDNSIQITGILNLILCVGFGLSDEENQLNSYKLFKKIWILISLISAVCYISYILKLPIPYTEVIYYNYNAKESYINYGLNFIYKTGDYLRLCGICNEPGAFGTITALLLCADKLNLKNKGNIIMLIAGIFTFSLAFTLMIFIYLIIKCFKNIKILAVLLLLLGGYIFVIPNIQFENENINRLIDRISIVYDGGLKTARSNSELDYLLKVTMNKHPIFGFGKGYVRSFSFGGIATYKIYLVDLGIGGCLLIWGLLLLSVLAQKNRNINVITFLIVFFASIYQRPDIMNLPYVLLLLGGIHFITSNDKEIYTKIKMEEN